MIKSKILIITTIFIACTFNACNEDFLETKPSNSVDAGSVFATTASANAAVNGIYRAMTRRFQGSQGYH